MIPVFIALTYAGLGMRETARLGEKALYQTAEQMKVMRVALQKANDLERKAKLFVLLSDPALRQPYERESYENVRNSFRQTLNELLQQPALDSRLTLLVNELLEKERLIHEQITGSDATPKLPVEDAFRGLRDAANGLWQEISVRVDRQVESLHRQSFELEQRMWVRTASLMGVSLASFLLILTVLNRSIRQLDTAIRRLGAGRFAETVNVRGPKDLRHLGERLDWLRGRLLNLEEAKQQFMHNVAREIEVPLASLRDDSALLVRELPDAGPAQAACARLQSRVDQLKAVSDELVRYSRVNESPILSERKDTDLKTLLEGVLADQREHLQAKSLRTKALIQRVPYHGIVDQLRGIFEQLISNAVKFSPEGGEIRVMLRVHGDAIEFEVEDDGPGIDADERADVLKPFHRGHAALALNTEGPGLGLAIAAEYVAHALGRLEILDPRQDQTGARVHVLIPRVDVN
ncbi:HAMP domain-containing histidine kinase [Methylococcus sp. EFPC2]|nr:HAMP domain-containing histidine kinase [Methylococcus sp. EFPC2]